MAEELVQQLHEPYATTEREPAQGVDKHRAFACGSRSHCDDGNSSKVHYNQDIDVQDAPLPAVAAFRKEIEAADAFIIACPEHNYSVSSAPKNALD
eukprot:scaffold4475_cov277-Chaetoceros_neogracile.AAC.1